jgi:hypothetical protein
MDHGDRLGSPSSQLVAKGKNHYPRTFALDHLPEHLLQQAGQNQKHSQLFFHSDILLC